ncbi:hypothetical protein [Streptococcus uberis]|nr:hypothetical protein [Streptococcus uberis]
MKETLISFFGISGEHAQKIIELPEPQRSRKIEELREWKIIKKIDWGNNV